MSGDTIHKTERSLKYAIICVSLILLMLAILITRDYLSLDRRQLISAQKLQLSALLSQHHPLTAGNVTIVSPWMTFSYINKLFNVPPDYLKTTLSISDPSYPQISLSGYAKREHVNVVLLINQVEGSLYTYLSASSTID